MSLMTELKEKNDTRVRNNIEYMVFNYQPPAEVFFKENTAKLGIDITRHQDKSLQSVVNFLVEVKKNSNGIYNKIEKSAIDLYGLASNQKIDNFLLTRQPNIINDNKVEIEKLIELFGKQDRICAELADAGVQITYDENKVPVSATGEGGEVFIEGYNNLVHIKAKASQLEAENRLTQEAMPYKVQEIFESYDIVENLFNSMREVYDPQARDDWNTEDMLDFMDGIISKLSQPTKCYDKPDLTESINELIDTIPKSTNLLKINLPGDIIRSETEYIAKKILYPDREFVYEPHVEQEFVPEVKDLLGELCYQERKEIIEFCITGDMGKELTYEEK